MVYVRYTGTHGPKFVEDGLLKVASLLDSLQGPRQAASTSKFLHTSAPSRAQIR
jgi:hypothetical protein